MAKKTLRSRVILITGLALATAGCPTSITNPPGPENLDTGDAEDTGDTGDTGGDTGQTSNPPPKGE